MPRAFLVGGVLTFGKPLSGRSGEVLNLGGNGSEDARGGRGSRLAGGIRIDALGRRGGDVPGSACGVHQFFELLGQPVDRRRDGQ